MVTENESAANVQNVDLWKQANDILNKNGYRWNGQELGSDDAKQEHFEKHGMWHVPFRGASRLSPN